MSDDARTLLIDQPHDKPAFFPSCAFFEICLATLDAAITGFRVAESAFKDRCQRLLSSVSDRSEDAKNEPC